MSDHLAQEMSLPSELRASLAEAAQSGSSSGKHTVNVQDGRRFASTYVAYHTSRVADKIACAYARFEASVETDGPSEATPPVQEVVECNGRMYAVFPSKAKDHSLEDLSMMDRWMDIPVGWSFVDLSGHDVASEMQAKHIIADVIAKHSWGTDWVIARQQGKWAAWYSKRSGYKSGTRCASHVDWFQLDASARRCCFRGWPARLLIQRVPTAELLSAWASYVELAARFRWQTALGIKTCEDTRHLSLQERAQRARLRTGNVIPSDLPPGLEDQEDNPYEEDGDGMVV